MTIVFRKPGEALIVRSDEAEVVDFPQASVKLLADSSSTGGALSTVQVSLSEGADGAKPHRHRNSAEMFYVLEGAIRVLSGTEVVSAERGDVVVVPPDLPHAFRAAPGSRVEILIVIAPGVERFEYFRKITRIAQGKEKPESLRDVQELYDTYFLNSPEWEAEQKR
jgi:mannose-6-phosphate isomerase-like protein (cupin superfamily)